MVEGFSEERREASLDRRRYAFGRFNSDSQAERLIEKYPDAAFVAGCSRQFAAKEDWIRSNMLNSLCGLKDDRLVPLLRDEAKGPFLKTRVNACVGLLELGQNEAVGLLVSEWNSAKVADDRHDWDLRDLRTALVHCGRIEALKALFGRWKEMPVNAKLEILRAMGIGTRTTPASRQPESFPKRWKCGLRHVSVSGTRTKI